MSIYDYKVKNRNGEEVSISDYKGKKEDIIDGIKNKMAMKAIEKISSSCKKDGDIKWNFTKFIIDREGNVVARYSPTFKPEDMEEKIKKLI